MASTASESGLWLFSPRSDGVVGGHYYRCTCCVGTYLHHVPSTSSVCERRHAQLPEALLIWQIPDVWDESSGSSLDSLYGLNILLKVWGPNEHPILERWPNESFIEVHHHFCIQVLVCSSHHPQDPVGLHYCFLDVGRVGQLLVYVNPKVLLNLTALDGHLSTRCICQVVILQMLVTC